MPRSEDLAGVDRAELGAITHHITAALMRDDMFPNFRNGPPWDGPLWLTIPTVTARAHVMMAMAMAMGMVSVATGLKLDGALAALRAHAYAADRTVDSIAQDIVHRNLPAASLADTDCFPSGERQPAWRRTAPRCHEPDRSRDIR